MPKKIMDAHTLRARYEMKERLAEFLARVGLSMHNSMNYSNGQTEVYMKIEIPDKI